MNSFLIIILISLVIAFISALILKEKGYRFSTTFVSMFIGLTAIISLVYNLIRPDL
ncbi:MAG: hypothetical protein IPG07_18035 [Crocinitomicaceae bacterium]|nr:hypothetical protein [Crocinitomicaceae bacterium]